MLRAAVLTVGSVLVLVGVGLCAVGWPNPGIQTLSLGGIAVVGVLFERWRYKNSAALRDGPWERTGERFVDPQTGQHMEVQYDPRSGERRYIPIEE
jgi:hypothetical protein